MARNKYISLKFQAQSPYDLTIFCTDKVTLEWAVSEVRKYCPSAKMRLGQLPNGEPFSCFFEKINAKYGDLIVGGVNMQMWIIKQLCEQGWTIASDEGFSAHNISLIIRAD